MRTLFLNIASQDGLIAVVADDKVASEVCLHHRSTDADLAEAFRVLTADEWPVESLERVACVVGPGGFTSLRVACAFSNALSHFQKIPLAGIHLSDLYAAQVSSPDAWWVHSTKRDLLFLRGFGAYAETVPEPILMRLEEVNQYVRAEDRWTGELIMEHRAQVDTRGLIQAEIKPLGDVLPAFLDSLAYQHQALEPWYGRGW